jgi:general secretion pathway protein L
MHSVLNEFLGWWLRQMLDLLPPNWRPKDAGPARALVIDCEQAVPATTATCTRRRSRRETTVGQINLAAPEGEPAARVRQHRNEPVVLRLRLAPLERDVVLPLAAEMAAERVLKMELDRLTPFAAEEVFWSWRLVRRDRSRARLHTLVTMVPKATLQPLLDALRNFRLIPQYLEAALPDGTVRRIPLLASRPRRVRTLLIAGCSAAAIAVATVVPFAVQQRDIAELHRQIAQLKPRVDRIEALRRQGAAGAVDADIVRAEQRRVGDAARVLATLTDLLPDDTYLTAFTMRQRQLTMNGQSSGAARLIETLSGGALIRSPAFTAPVLRDQSSGVDTFSLHAELTP